MQNVTTAYYLVHLMSGSKDFERQDRQAAMNFAQAGKRAGADYLSAPAKEKSLAGARARTILTFEFAVAPFVKR
jgi:hypothetical protein